MPEIKLNLNKDDSQILEGFIRLVKKKGLETALRNMRSMARVPMHAYAADYIDQIVHREKLDPASDEGLLFLASLLVAFMHGWTIGRESLKRGEV